MRYWKLPAIGNTVESVERHSNDDKVPGAIRISKAKYDAFIAALPKPPPAPPQRNLGAEIDDHEARLKKLEEK